MFASSRSRRAGHTVVVKNMKVITVGSAEEDAEEENFFIQDRKICSGARGCGGEGQNRRTVFFTLFPGLPFLAGHELHESINIERPPSSHPKRIFFRWVCGRPCGEATSRVGGWDFDVVEPEAANGSQRLGG